MANIKLAGTDISSGQNKSVTGGDTIRPDTGLLAVAAGSPATATSSGNQLSMIGGSGGATSGNGGAVAILGGSCTVGNGGNLVFTSGSGGSTSGSSGNISIVTGAATSGNSGFIEIRSENVTGDTGYAGCWSGDTTGATATTGIAFVFSGNTTNVAGSGSTGDVYLYSGTASGSGASGNCYIQTGPTNSGNGGFVEIKTDTSTSGNTGDIVIKTGNAASGNTGNVSIRTGTGTGTGGQIALVASDSLTRAIYNGRVALTDNTATAVATVNMAANTMSGGTIRYSIHATNATDFQVLTGSVTFSAVDKAGVLTSDIDENATQSLALSTGTLTDTWSINDGTNLINIRVAADTSLTPTSLICYLTLEVWSATATATVP